MTPVEHRAALIELRRVLSRIAADDARRVAEKDDKPMTNQARVDAWMPKPFTQEEIANATERSLRTVEEALELAQACGVDVGMLHRQVDYVFSRPVGKPAQEIAGCMVTLYATASALGVDADAAFEVELARIEQPEIIERCRRRQHEKREALKQASVQVDALVDVSPQDTTRLPPAMVAELGRRIWFLRGKTHWEAWSEHDLDAVLAGDAAASATVQPAPASANPWRDALPKCHWGTSCGRIGTKWVARHVTYCDVHGASYLQDTPWAELARSEVP